MLSGLFWIKNCLKIKRQKCLSKFSVGGLIYGCLVNSTGWILYHFDLVQTKKDRKRSFGDSFGDGNALSSNKRGRRLNPLWGSDFIFLFESGSRIVRNYAKRILVEGLW